MLTLFISLFLHNERIMLYGDMRYTEIINAILIGWFVAFYFVPLYAFTYLFLMVNLHWFAAAAAIRFSHG